MALRVKDNIIETQKNIIRQKNDMITQKDDMIQSAQQKYDRLEQENIILHERLNKVATMTNVTEERNDRCTSQIMKFGVHNVLTVIPLLIFLKLYVMD